MRKGALITLEGIEGSGKSGHLKLLAQFLQGQGFAVHATYEPGATPLGRSLRELLLHGEGLVEDPLVELLLFLLDRREHVRLVIKPSLLEGKVVLCDRYVDSTLAYQGFGRGLDPDFVLRANRLVTEGVWPDLTILLDCPPEEGLQRTKGEDRLQRQPLEFHRRVREGYLELARREPERIRVVSTSGRPREEAQEEIRSIVLEFLRRWPRET